MVILQYFPNGAASFDNTQESLNLTTNVGLSRCYIHTAGKKTQTPSNLFFFSR